MIDILTCMYTLPARKLENKAVCRGTECLLEDNIIPRGTLVIPIEVKGNPVFMCPTCTLLFAEKLREQAETLLTAHEVARALLRR